MSEVFIINIEDATLDNKNYRKVLYTSTNLHGMQLVVMSLKPSEEIGMEKHAEADQFIRIEQGEAIVQIGKTKKDVYKLDANDSILIPAGTWHKIVNSNDHYPLKLYTLYTPPQHKDKLVQKLKPKID
jgi:mannose-6-phosphate isomerase-like protein (cupin superfamily)